MHIGLLNAAKMLYIYSKYVAVMKMSNYPLAVEAQSPYRVKERTFVYGDKSYRWTNNMERIRVIREGIPYDSLDFISSQLNVSVKAALAIVGMPQTTYNKKKSEHSLLDQRNSELILLIIELIQYGQEVFNQEKEKFQRWLKKSNSSLGGQTPESMLDTTSGIEELRKCLSRIEYGTFA
jgi:putative toxin-antitoxin system antitoxin component (TIGR02293 family)